MPQNSKTQSVTIVGGRNVAPTETTKPRGRPPKEPEPEKTTEPKKEPENE